MGNSIPRRCAIDLERMVNMPALRQHLTQDEADWCQLLADRLFEIHNRRNLTEQTA